MSGVNVDIAALAKLARLEVSEEELAKLEKEIPSILAFVETIQKAGVSKVKESHEMRNVMRADGPPAGGPHESGIHTEKLLSAAPTREGDRIAVKQVMSRKKNRE